MEVAKTGCLIGLSAACLATVVWVAANHVKKKKEDFIEFYSWF